MKKQLSPNPIHITTIEEALELEKTYRVNNQRIIFECSVCGKSTIKRLVVVRRGLLCGLCLHKRVCLEKYGVENPSQSPSVKEKKAKTTFKHYGVSNPSQSSEVKEKIKLACREKYGVDCYLQSEDGISKARKTCMEKYGTDYYSQTEEGKTKTSNTCIERYGGKSSMSSLEVREKARKTNLEKYGVENPGSLKIIVAKRESTMLERYGRVNAMQVPELNRKQKKKYRFEGINFDSSWELAYYIWLRDQGIEFEYQCEAISYLDGVGKERFYIPDFKVDGRLVEIKGSQFFDEDGSFRIPYKMDDAEEIAVGKWECMKSHNVLIVTDVRKQLDYVESKYGVDYLNQFRVGY